MNRGIAFPDMEAIMGMGMRRGGNSRSHLPTQMGPLHISGRNRALPMAAHKEYRRAELLADNVIHLAGVVLGLAGAIWLATLAAPGKRLVLAIYSAGLVTMLSASAAYNMWPHQPLKGWLRRVDHSAIYIMIAATYTPFIAQIADDWLRLSFFAVIWAVAIGGVALKLTMPGRFDPLSIVLYLVLGWSGLAAYDALGQALDHRTWVLLGIGGAIYSVGVVFHLAEALPFHNAIWHGFVLVAAICHYFTVLSLL
jgi:hemolysin III